MKKRMNLCDSIVEDIKREIIDGSLKPGIKIAGEFDLAEKYEVSRFTVREAMKKLDSMGLITIKHGVGSFVNTVTPEAYMKGLLPVIIMSDNDMERICEARLGLEEQSVSLCAERASDEEIDGMQKLIDNMQECVENNDHDRYNELDLEFHMLIAEASRNQIIFEMLKMLQELLKVQIKRVSTAPNSWERSIRRHRQMLEAVRNGEKELAQQLMTLHINDSIEYLVAGEKSKSK